jgi:peptidyl-prolyl cis-trans isomerase SurA
MESEGRVGTTFFSGMMAAQESGTVVANVNGEVLRGGDLELSIGQLEQTAIAQGQNPQDPQIQTEIRELATEMLVNTTLLQQAAEEAGITVTAEQIEERIVQLETESGGAEVLMARMEELDIDRSTFEADVRTELTIVALLDTVFAGLDLSASDEEVSAVYEQAASSQEGVPPLEEVRDQVEAQVIQDKQQAAVDAYIDELRAAADIEIVS